MVMATFDQSEFLEQPRRRLAWSNEKILTVARGYSAVHLGVAEVKHNVGLIARKVANGVQGSWIPPGEYPPRHVRDH